MYIFGWIYCVTVSATAVGSIPAQGNELCYFLIFLFLRSGIKAKRGVEFHHSSAISQKLGKCLSTKFNVCLFSVCQSELTVKTA